ncbi:MAG: hypothetical protein JGK12_26935 [Microcoleus sp. PH2017_01_SCD_O_A]|uniref:hypothetical protein n=1 Tax=unclassified Microcoleus TaxID=2642155 RepID=UPI001DE2085A|nr:MULTISPECIES: hypothetical protein [unclassified Microcoleus]MCC3418007.1 hypothetical protein [Microcoleus sp. PH2017_07_MST_O_A]MCC3513851.1 hypothetical protein [Microcoleus sp. PH2017_17_BER_D_A]MCC3427450.1 hypothetical protein [Microcoleus sp. PH2017_01_SCD_O_A]MCC3473175.1 hypothetical protein [Microcoleus sp. PH2017_13_LAR_U_A]MCC3485579.1 hypothetical protein [Microcoleus sp. PH2017_14_LAR_D_A]
MAIGVGLAAGGIAASSGTDKVFLFVELRDRPYRSQHHLVAHQTEKIGQKVDRTD